MDTENADVVKPPLWYWIAGGLALIWNLLGVMAFFGSLKITQAELVEAYGQERADLIAAQPEWYPIVFGLAVFGGAIGCLGLLLRKNWAGHALILSLIAVIIQNIYFFVLSDVGKYVHGGEWVMTLMIPIVAVLLVLLARKAKAAAWTS